MLQKFLAGKIPPSSSGAALEGTSDAGMEVGYALDGDPLSDEAGDGGFSQEQHSIKAKSVVDGASSTQVNLALPSSFTASGNLPGDAVALAYMISRGRTGAPIPIPMSSGGNKCSGNINDRNSVGGASKSGPFKDALNRGQKKNFMNSDLGGKMSYCPIPVAGDEFVDAKVPEGLPVEQVWG